MEVIKKANKKRIRQFAYEAFGRILSNEINCVPKESRRITRNVIKRLSDKCSGKRPLFTENIESAVCLTRELLMHYFVPFFDLNLQCGSKDTFINNFKLILLHWLQKRDNIFVKIIDTLAIITYAFLYCVYFKKFLSNIKYITTQLINLLEEIFSSEFFQKGGWSRLNERAEMWYRNLYAEYNAKEPDESYCNFVSLLRKSTVMFPVPEAWLCDKCKLPQDKNMTGQIIYVTPNYAFLNFLDRKSFDEIGTETEKVSVDKEIESIKNGDSFVESETNIIVPRENSTDTKMEDLDAEKNFDKLVERGKDSVNTVKESVDISNSPFDERIGTKDAGKFHVNNGKLNADDKIRLLSAGRIYEGDKKDPVGVENEPLCDKKDPVVDEKDLVYESRRRKIIVNEYSLSKKKYICSRNKYSGNGKKFDRTGKRCNSIKKAYRDLDIENYNSEPLKGSSNIEKKLTNVECERAGKEFTDTGKVTRDAEKQLIDTVKGFYDFKNNLILSGKDTATSKKGPATSEKGPATSEKDPATSEKDPAADGKDPAADGKYPAADGRGPVADGNEIEDVITAKKVIHPVVASASKEVYNSDFRQEMNQNLLEVFIGKACKIDTVESNDFCFIAENYSHSVENMTKEVFTIQSSNIGIFSDISHDVKTSDYSNPILSERFFCYIPAVSVFIGGGKINSKRRRKKQNKKFVIA